ncbi:hypothetical protein [Bradyrhizobium sp. Tv2a-2]|uniref:hypothetical protein n=1 Tax=Bradyrhizobium sp. Tv2a-2 TaxID=113395 RepID=UPI00040210E5|nr:hypothetical protein [Bradyrhizobium sp. Tv2a-2]
MTISHTLVRAALIVSAQFATPVLAQAVIDEPGNYAFFHPNADVLNPPRPTDAMAAQLSPDRNVGGLRLAVQPRHSRHASSAKPY